jgi:hypothetical protein
MIVSPSGFRAWPVQEWLHRDPHNESGVIMWRRRQVVCDFAAADGLSSQLI